MRVGRKPESQPALALTSDGTDARHLGEWSVYGGQANDRNQGSRKAPGMSPSAQLWADTRDPGQGGQDHYLLNRYSPELCDKISISRVRVKGKKRS